MDFWEFYKAINLHIHFKIFHWSVWANNHVLAVFGIITTMKSNSLNEKKGIFVQNYTWEKSTFHDAKAWLKYMKWKFVYKVNTKTNLWYKVITVKEIDFEHWPLSKFWAKF